ncbi:hypothetical protein RRG08_040373 [Elysia crispata]|uniref:Dermatopontin n=1 Tax=Elysia crispata TaxID=231223 RepID=A0AAE1A229_9GAST|nr:hypothetical protein RRG08_040373 [Elysia crispata]
MFSPPLAFVVVTLALTCNSAWAASFVNNWDEKFKYECPTNQTLSYVYSTHSNHHEDRRWMFKCCHIESYKTTGCEWTPYLNSFDHVLNYAVPEDRVLIGWFSEHKNKAEDRRHRMLTCNLSK